MVAENASNPLNLQDSLSPDILNLLGSKGLEVESYRSTSSFQPASPSVTSNLSLPGTVQASSQLPFASGVFTVGSTGQVGIDYLFDGGGYQGELAIFSLQGLESFGLGTPEFIQEIARRALSNSTLGHVVISDQTEGARFSGELPWEGDFNAGNYLGVRTFAMRPGDTFGVAIVPNGTFQQIFETPDAEGELHPLFSLVSANPNSAFQFGQIADVDGNGRTFTMEDLRLDCESDRDYNDIIFQVRGATGSAVKLDSVIDADHDWRKTDLGQNLMRFIQPPKNQPLIGVIDTGLSSNPDINPYNIHFGPGSDYVAGDGNPLLQPGEGNQHGTHITGIIAATRDNGIGIDGINDQAPIYVQRAVGSGKWAQALVDFVDAAKEIGQPHAIANLSFDLTQLNPDGTTTTRYEFTPEERKALEYARQNGVLIVAAAGNDGGTMSALGQASQEFDNILTVGSVDYSGRRAVYSNFGDGLDIVAYGGTVDEPILSTVGNGTDLKFLIEGLGALGGEVAGLVQSVLDTIPTDFSNPDLGTAIIPSLNVSNEMSSLLEQAYEDSWKEVAAIFTNDSEFSSDDLSDEEKALLQSQVDLENLLGEFESFLDALSPDFLAVLNNPEVADLLALLEEPGASADEDLDLGVGEMAGTSVAAATVTGVVSQIWAANPQLSYAQVKDILKRTAIDLGSPGWDAETGAGLIDLAAAVSVAERTPPQFYQPEAFATPTTWGGEGSLQPTERAANFYGTIENKLAVQINGGVNIRSGSSTTYAFLGKLPAGTRLEFDQEVQGQFVTDPNGQGSSNIWYHLTDGRGWVSAVYVGQIQQIQQPQPQPQPQPQSQPQPQPQPQPGYSVQGGIRQRWLQNLWLGEPRSNEIGQGNGVVIQYFANGYIIWNGRSATAYRTKAATISRVSPTPRSRATLAGISINRAYFDIAAAKQGVMRMLAASRSNISLFRSLLKNPSLQADRLANFRYLKKVQSYRPTNGIDLTADLFTGNYLFGPTVCGVGPGRDYNEVQQIPYSKWNSIWNQQQAACAAHDYAIHKTGKDPMKDWTDPGIIKAHARLAAASPSSAMRNAFSALAVVGALGYGAQKLNKSSSEAYSGFNRWATNFSTSVVKWAYPNYPI